MSKGVAIAVFVVLVVVILKISATVSEKACSLLPCSIGS